MKNNQNKYYIFLDISSNSCMWDEQDNMKKFGQKKHPQDYSLEARTEVGEDAIAGLNVLADYARETLGKKPVLVLTLHRTSSRQTQIFAKVRQNLSGKLKIDEIEDYTYNSYGDFPNFGRAVSLKLYNDAHGKDMHKKPSFFDRFHFGYSKKVTDFVAITDAEKNVKDQYENKFYVNYTNLIAFDYTPGEALDANMADAFADLDSFRRNISRTDMARERYFGKVTEEEELAAEALSEFAAQTDRMFEEADAFVEEIEEAEMERE